MKQLAGALLGLAVVAVPAQKVVPVPAKTEVASVALAGSHVAWTNASGRPVVRLDRTVVWRAWKVPVPGDAASDPSFDVGVAQGASVVAASPRRIAILHAADLVFVPKCRKADPPCLAPEFTRPALGEIWVGPPRGPFHRVSGAPKACPQRAIAVDVDASGADVAIAERFPVCEGETSSRELERVVLIRAGRGQRVLRSSRELVFRAVAIAGRYAAWTEESRGASTGQFALVVYNLRLGRVAYRLASQTGGVPQIDVQPDGTVVFMAGVRGSACDGTVGWASRVRPEPRYLSVNAIGPVLAARNRVVFASRRNCTTPEAPRLVVAGLGGAVRTIARPPALGAVAFDGRRVAFVTRRSGRPVIVVRPLR
jgi:hypothetical protein